MAAKRNEAYVKFDADTKEFEKGISKMDAALNKSREELKLNATQLKGTGDNTELLANRQNILQNELEAASKKVELTEKKLAICKETLGENSKQYEKLSSDVLKAKNVQQGIQNELEKTVQKLEKVESANKEAVTSFGKLENEISKQENTIANLKKNYANLIIEQGEGSKESKDLAKQIQTLSGELSENKSKLKEAENAANKLDKSFDDLGESAKESGDGFTVAGGAIATFVGNGLTSIANGIGNAISSVASLEEETREYRTEMGKLDTAFTTNGFSVEQAENTYKNFYEVLGDEGQTVEAVSHLAKLTTSQKELDQWTTIATGVYGTFGNSLPIENLTEAANETAKVGQVTGGLADALNWAGVSEDEFNTKLESLSTEQERQQYITSTLNGLYGEAAQRYRETNGEVMNANRTQSDYTDTMAQFGEKVAPITDAVKTGFSGLLQEVLGLTEGVDFNAVSESISNAFSFVSENVLPAVVEGFNGIKTAWEWLQEHKTLMAVLASAVGVLAVAVGAYTVVQGIQAAMNAAEVTTLGALIAAKWASAAATMAALAPYILIVAAIAAVIAIIVVCVKHWDKIKAKITEVAQKVKEKATQLKNDLVGRITEAKNKAVEIFENIKKNVSDKITALKNKVTSIFNSVKEKIVTPIQNAKNTAVNAFTSLQTNVQNKIFALRTKVTSTFNSIKEKIVTPINKARDSVKNAVDKIKNFFNNMKLKFPKIKMPSFAVTGKFSLDPPQVPKLSIKWNALGGVFTKPTVLQGFGEAGTEYALPLNERSLTPLAVMLNKLTLSGENGLADILASRFDNAVIKLTDRLERLESNIYIDGKKVATSTASYNDKESGLRNQLAERGVALS